MSLSPAEQEDFEERAAIMEFDGRMRRDKAETLAMGIILSKRKKPNTSTSTTSKESRHGNRGQ